MHTAVLNIPTTFLLVLLTPAFSFPLLQSVSWRWSPTDTEYRCNNKKKVANCTRGTFVYMHYRLSSMSLAIIMLSLACRLHTWGLWEMHLFSRQFFFFLVQNGSQPMFLWVLFQQWCVLSGFKMLHSTLVALTVHSYKWLNKVYCYGESDLQSAKMVMGNTTYNTLLPPSLYSGLTDFLWIHTLYHSGPESLSFLYF